MASDLIQLKDGDYLIVCNYKCGWNVRCDILDANKVTDEHIRVCKLHPMRQLEKENRRLKSKVQQLKKQLRKLQYPKATP